MSNLSKIFLRKSSSRGYFDHGWLKSYHSFSFADYYDPNYEQFGCLRVLNEDFISPSNGFPTHPHKAYQIFSYIVSGEITHKDSMGFNETIKRGGIQYTDAGTGIFHSEFNNDKKVPLHLCQVWTTAKDKFKAPHYTTLYFNDEDKVGKLLKVVSETGDDKTCIAINSPCDVYASILPSPSHSVNFTLEKGHKCHIHLIKHDGSSVKVNDTVMEPGDACFIEEQPQNFELKITGNSDKAAAEFLLFDLNK
jgi:redox-sensitive bicupin YhaK (pirin superfamily)